MSTISVPYTFSAGAVIVASEHNNNFSTIYNDYNGSITNINISASANIADTKLATITTAGKVNISALTVASQAAGDIIHATSGSAWARLAAGTSSQLLHGGTTPSWSALGASDFPSNSLIQRVQTQSGSLISPTSTAIPIDDTIPQNTEGGAITDLDTAITPNNTSNVLVIEALINCASAGGSAPLALALFQDSTAGSLAVGLVNNPNNDLTNQIKICHKMTAGTTSATTFKLRVGNAAGDQITVNGFAGNRKFGGVLISSLSVSEYKA